MPTDAAIMMNMFEGSDLAHGRTDVGQKDKRKGKLETNSWLEKRAVTEEDWKGHLDGVRGIGIPPLNSNNEVKWGAIDVDVYEGLDLNKLNTLIQDTGLPLVICRSKSGGPHIFLFLKDWVPAKDMIEALDGIAGYLGFGRSEIFPKQAMIAQSEDSTDFGSWINMPYFGGTRYLRYALDTEGKALKSVEAFAEFVESRRTTLEGLPDLSRGAPPSVDVPLPDGPPCLNRIMTDAPGDMRNVILSNIAVYCKKRWPDNDGWKGQLDKYNQMFAEPLGSGEVEAIKKSYTKKDYRYQCSKQPLCSYCNSSACKKTAYGIGQQDMMPANRSLSMVASTPVVWYLDIELPDGDRRISLSTEQLQQPSLFQRRCMEVLQQMPPVMKQEDWQPIVAGLMEHCSVINVPPELTPAGQFKELLRDFLTDRSAEGSFEDLIRNVPFKNEEGWHFRPKSLWAYIKNQRFDQLKQGEMVAVLRKDLGASPGFRQIAGKGVRFLTIPPDAFDAETSALPLKVSSFQDKSVF